jgi:glutathione S-transferase
VDRHPFGRVPVLEHDGFSLYETQAILRYLDRVLPEPALTPVDPREAGRMDQMMNINDWYLFQGVANVIVFQRLIRPRLMGSPADEAEIAAAMPRARTVFAELSRQLGDRNYFAGSALSLADILIAPQLDFFSETPEWSQLVSPDDNLSRWLLRIRARPSMAATTRERIIDRLKAA